jgi:Ca-activated chloride channel homolog
LGNMNVRMVVRWILVPLVTVCMLMVRSDGLAQSSDPTLDSVSGASRDRREAAWQTSIHSEVNLTNMSFTVRDSHGTLVDNLVKDDFDVFEDGVPQKIAFFARSVDVPLTLGLIVDASDSQSHFNKQHHHDLEVFLNEVLGPKDRAFVIGFGNHLRLASDFTQSSRTLLEGLEAYEHDTRHFTEIGPKEERDLGTAFYDSIYYSVTEKLAFENGRRALLVFSDGEDNSSSHDMMTTIETAQAENVLVFTIRYTQKEHGKLTARNKYGIRVMERIAKETGGTQIDAETTDPHTYFRQIAVELRTSYELAGLVVRAKTGYFVRAAR